MQKVIRDSSKPGFLFGMMLPVLLFVGLSARAETPEQFIRRFSDFKFEFHTQVQEPETFLASKKGDCDDFATLADSVLGASGYTTRLISVRMQGETHVVCYVEETGSYLDFNMRTSATPLVRSDGVLTHVADQVAKSFGKPWVAAYEFTYRDGFKKLASRIVPNQPYLAALGMPNAAAGGQGN